MAQQHHLEYQQLLSVTVDDLHYYHVETWMTRARYKPILIGLVAFEKFIDSQHIAAYWRQNRTLNELLSNNKMKEMAPNDQVDDVRAHIRQCLPHIVFADLDEDILGLTDRATANTPPIQLNSLFYSCCEENMSMDKVVTLAFCVFQTLTHELSHTKLGFKQVNGRLAGAFNNSDEISSISKFRTAKLEEGESGDWVTNLLFHVDDIGLDWESCDEILLRLYQDEDEFVETVLELNRAVHILLDPANDNLDLRAPHGGHGHEDDDGDDGDAPEGGDGHEDDGDGDKKNKKRPRQPKKDDDDDDDDDEQEFGPSKKRVLRSYNKKEAPLPLLTRSDFLEVKHTWPSKSNEELKQLCDRVKKTDRSSVFCGIFSRTGPRFPEDKARFVVDQLVTDEDVKEMFMNEDEVIDGEEYQVPYMAYLRQLPLEVQRLRWAVESSKSGCVTYFQIFPRKHREHRCYFFIAKDGIYPRKKTPPYWFAKDPIP